MAAKWRCKVGWHATILNACEVVGEAYGRKEAIDAVLDAMRSLEWNEDLTYEEMEVVWKYLFSAEKALYDGEKPWFVWDDCRSALMTLKDLCKIKGVE